MDLEGVKALIKKYQAGHMEFLRRAETAERYYRNRTDILLPKPKPVKESDGAPDKPPLRNADNRIPFNFHGLLVNQKASYLFTAPPIFDLGNKTANKALSAFLGDKYAKVCKDLCIDASNTSVGWLHLWKDNGTGAYRYAVVPSAQIVPVWGTSLEKELLGVLRCYHDIRDDGKEYDIYEYWNDIICQAYEVEAGYTVEERLAPYYTFTVFGADGSSASAYEFTHGIGEVPFFPFFNNNTNTGDLDNIKPLIDTYCKVFSGFVNDLEDIQEVIFVLTNYGGADLGQFLRELKDYKAIQVESNGTDDRSGVSTLTIELPVEARKELLAVTRKCIFEQGQGIDPDPQNFGNSSGVALNFLYALLELKSGLQETEFRQGFGRFIRCVCRLIGIPIRDDAIVQTWTRTSVRNDQEIAGICAQSKGVISDQTIIEHHPYVEDPEKEMTRIKEEAEAALEAADPYQNAFTGSAGKGETHGRGREEER